MLFFAALLVSISALQTDQLSLSGVVFDTNAKPVAEVHVHLEEPTEQKQWDMDTKADGMFHFDRLSFGTYRVTISHEG